MLSRHSSHWNIHKRDESRQTLAVLSAKPRNGCSHFKRPSIRLAQDCPVWEWPGKTSQCSSPWGRGKDSLSERVRVGPCCLPHRTQQASSCPNFDRSLRWFVVLLALLSHFLVARVPWFWRKDRQSLPTFVSFVYVSMGGMSGKHSAELKTPRRRGQHLRRWNQRQSERFYQTSAESLGVACTLRSFLTKKSKKSNFMLLCTKWSGKQVWDNRIWTRQVLSWFSVRDIALLAMTTVRRSIVGLSSALWLVRKFGFVRWGWLFPLLWSLDTSYWGYFSLPQLAIVLTDTPTMPDSSRHRSSISLTTSTAPGTMSSILFAKHVSFEHSVTSPYPVFTSRREEKNNKAKVFQHPIDSHSQSASSCPISPQFTAGAVRVGRGAASFLATESTRTVLIPRRMTRIAGHALPSDSCLRVHTGPVCNVSRFLKEW